MLKQDAECHIVNTASMAGLISGPTLGIYKVTKHGVVSLSETLYCELAERGAKIKITDPAGIPLIRQRMEAILEGRHPA
jgi:short-subunit dehydrogenase